VDHSGEEIETGKSCLSPHLPGLPENQRPERKADSDQDEIRDDMRDPVQDNELADDRQIHDHMLSPYRTVTATTIPASLRSSRVIDLILSAKGCSDRGITWPGAVARQPTTTSGGATAISSTW
jgi:hypothetical protein